MGYFDDSLACYCKRRYAEDPSLCGVGVASMRHEDIPAAVYLQGAWEILCAPQWNITTYNCETVESEEQNPKYNYDVNQAILIGVGILVFVIYCTCVVFYGLGSKAEDTDASDLCVERWHQDHPEPCFCQLAKPSEPCRKRKFFRIPKALRGILRFGNADDSVADLSDSGHCIPEFEPGVEQPPSV